MKTKQAKEDLDKNIDEEIVEPKTRGRKKASEINEQKHNQDEPKTSKEPKKNVTKPRAVIKKRPLGIRKALRSKKVIFVTETAKNVIKGKRGGRKTVTKTEPDNSQEKEAVPLIPASEIKKEPVEETSNSRSSSPRTAGRRQRLSSDMIMMKSVLGDSPSSLVLGPRTSPYSMRSERSNSPSTFETKNLRSGKPRKAKNNLLNEVVMKEQKKRRRLLSDSKATDAGESTADCKKKRGRSCSRDGSEISKCSDITESDVSLSEPLNDSDGKELNKKLDKPKTELDIDIENSIQISTIQKVPLIVDSKSSEDKTEAEPSSNANKKKKLSLKRSTSLDSDNNNSNRLILEKLNTAELEEKLLLKTVDNDTLFEARSSILSSMSRTFNSKEMSKNIRRARRGRKAAAATKPSPSPAAAAKNGISSTTATISTIETSEDKQETLETLSKEIDDLINDLDQNIDRDRETASNVTVPETENIADQMQTKAVSKFYGLSKPLGDNNSIITPETPVKDKDAIQIINDNTPSKSDDSENIRLCYHDDSFEKITDNSKQEITYKCTSTVASIDKLMDRLKEFEEFDKRRQRQEIEKSNDTKSVMVTNDVVLIPKSGADIKPLKDIQSVRSPEKPIEKENVLSCFENNSAISIVKRDQVRKSIDIDLPNSVTLIKRNSISARKESTSSNHSKDDAISIFEKSLGKDVTLTEIKKSVDKSVPTTPIDLHQFATLHPNNSSQGVVLDPKAFLITPRMVSKRKSLESISRKSSESATETEEKMAVVEKIKSPPSQIKPHTVVMTPTPVAVESQVAQPLKTEALVLPLESVKAIPEDIPLTSEVPKVDSVKVQETASSTEQTVQPSRTIVTEDKVSDKVGEAKTENIAVDKVPEKMVVDEQQSEKPIETDVHKGVKVEKTAKSVENKTLQNAEVTKPVKSQGKAVKPSRGLTETLKLAEVPKPTEIRNSSETQKPSEIKISAEIQKSTEVHKSTQIQKTTEVCKATEVQKPKANDSKESQKPTDILKPAEMQKSVEVCKTPEAEIPAENCKSTAILKATDVQKATEIQKPTEAQKSEIRKSIERKSLERKSDRKSTERKSAERKSIESQPGPSYLLIETPENQKNKENILRTLGLLTHKAAKEAKIEKLKEKERIYGSYNMLSNKNKSKSGDYTGTLKTVIKLNRSSDKEKKKYRSSLKMTFQKSKHRGRPEEATNEDEYYTIERREGGASAASDGGHRKSHYSNRLNNHETEAAPEPTEPKESPNLVIPEKASSFSIHPGRLCMDQCFYCGGKFGLFDTPCHIAQMKSSERQKKVLDNEEKLTIDSCLCDACYRHVDRRANCPSYRKRPVIKQLVDSPATQLPSSTFNTTQTTEKPISPKLEDESEEETPAPTLASGRPATCHTEGCANPADRFIRRKWLIKMRNSVSKVLKLECDYPGLHTIPLCAEHYRALAPLMACALCRRNITKHHNVHILSHGYLELNTLLHEVGIPVQFTERPVLCKVCRYYCSVLQRPGYDKTAKGYTYTRKLLQKYNIDVPPGPENQIDEMSIQEESFRQTDRQKRKQRGKNKRQSTEPEKSESESITPEKTDRILESPPQKEMTPEQDATKNEHLEEDIESLISSNKIPVPGAAKDMIHTEGTENEMIIDMDTPILPIDKQTELQYLLQKQNNPAQFLKNPANLTQKQRNILKLQNLSGIHKPGHHHKICDKNAKRIHKIGQNLLAQNDRISKSQEIEMFDLEKSKDGINILKNISLNDECTIETIPNKKPADINQLKNKWQMSESFTQVKKNLSELSKKLTVEKEPKKSSEVKYSNPVKRLETNPSISVRELFPGEEEMNLQCNIEFNNVKGVTPEGWEKCNTLIQYDLETKRLWSDLQRPYGNQSSFLRHLILLEKYFRSGDLVLSHNASPNAVNYSDSVHSRLRAYDNIVNDAPRRSEPAISLIEFRKKPVNGKSLLKSNQSDLDDTKKFMPPPGVLPKSKSKDKSKSKPLPPELIAINTPKKSMQNVLHNIQQLVKGVSASDPTEVAAAPLPPPKFEPPKEKKEVHKSDAPKKTKTTSKPWRPTLMPITPENLSKVAREPTQVAVDGRHLRSLVQVMSSGKQYHITLQDYNKMCIMRREKLQQIQDKETKTKRLSTDETSVVTEIQPSAMLGNGGTLLQTIEKEDKSIDVTQIGTNAATILKNVGLKNITIAPITPKTATVTSQTAPIPVVTSPSLLVMSTPMKLPQLGPAVSITSEPILSAISTPLVMPKIPKSLTVIPQTTNIPQNIIVSDVPMPSQAVIGNRP